MRSSIKPSIGPVLAIVLGDGADEDFFVRFVQLMVDQGAVLPPNSTFRVFVGLKGFAAAILNLQSLQGLVIDRTLLNTKDESHKKILKMLEDVKLPTLRLIPANLRGGAVEQKILSGQWMQFEDELSRYSPRGLRDHPRKIAYVKILLMKDANTPDRMIRCVTFDISLGGIFIVTMEDLNFPDDVFFSFGDSKSFAKAKVCWRLPWGRSEWHLPGIGVQFVDPSDELLAELRKYMEI